MSVLRTQLRGVARRPARLLLTGLSIIVASFFAFAVLLAQQVTERTMLDSFSETPEAVDAVVQANPSRPLPAATIAQLRAVPGVAEVAGQIAGTVAPAGAPQGGVLYQLTADPGSGPLARVKLTEGAYPSRPGQVAVDSRTAQERALRIGSRLNLVTSEEKPRPIPVVITGITSSSGHGIPSFYAPDRVAAAMLQQGFTRIELRATAGTSPQALVAATSAVLPASSAGDAPTVRDGATVRNEEATAAVQSIDELFLLLSVFVLIAVIAAALVASSTFRIVFAQRMRQLALLRAVGAGRGRLAVAMALEGVLVGLVAGTAGVLTAFATGHVVTAVVSATVRELAAPRFPIAAAVGIVLGAVLVTLLAVLTPAVSASKVSPLEALRTSATTGGRARIGILRFIIGALLALFAAGSALLVFVQAYSAAQEKGSDGSGLGIMLVAIVLSGTAAFLALIALGPLIITPVVRLLGAPIRRTGAVGQLAVGGVGGMPRRAAAVCAVVALGVMLVAGVIVGSASLRTFADSELAAACPADLQIAGTDDAALPAGAVTRLRQRPELTNLVPYRRLAVSPTSSDISGLTMTDLRLTALRTAGDLRTVGGSLDAIAPGRVAISDSMADLLGVQAGDSIELTAGGRTNTVTVVTVLSGSGPLNTAFVADPADLDRLGAARAATGVLADIRGDREKVTEALRATVSGGEAGVQIDELYKMREEAASWINGLTGLVLGLLGLTVLIAVVGVGTTMVLSVVERTRETGMLRAVGLSRAGLRSTIAIEAGLYGLVGSALGLALGVPYAWLMVYSLDLGAPMVAPVAQLFGVVAALAGLTVLAGLLPARRAARVSPVAALAVE